MTYAIPGAWAEHAACLHATARMEMPDANPNGVQKRAERARHHIDAARTICHACPVRIDCATWALTEPDPAFDMIAGGLTPKERHDARRAAHIAAAHTPPDPAEPRRCPMCGYSLDGAHHLRRYCSDACNPSVTTTSRRRWDDQLEETG